MGPGVSAGVKKYLNPSAKDHGSEGQVLLLLYLKSRSVTRLFKKLELIGL